MAGTNKQNKFIFSKPSIILKSPQLAENIGMSARSMVNYGFSDLRIVNTKVSWPNNKAISSSAGAFDFISKTTKQYKKLEESLEGVDILFATSVRTRDLEKTILTPKQAISIIKKLYIKKNIGFLFGPEKAGLNNNDLSEANYVIQIPTNPKFGSLNLAMAVNIICHEWLNNEHKELLKNILKESKLADKKNLLIFKNFLIKTMNEVNFFENQNQEKMEINLKNIFSKSFITDKELSILYGVIKSLKEYKN